MPEKVTGKVSEVMKKVIKLFASLPKQVLVLLVPLLSWVSILIYFEGNLTIERVKQALASGNLIDLIAVIALISTVAVFILSITWFIRDLIPRLIATGGYVLAFFMLVLALYGLIRGLAVSIVSLILTFVLLIASIVLGRVK